MSASSDQQRERQIKEKDKSLRKVTLDACFRTKNSEGFQAYFRSVVLNSALSNGSDTVKRFIASLDPLRSFTTAASAASQDEEGVHIIWAAMHALIEVSCQLLFTTTRLCVTKWLRWRRCSGCFPLYRDIQIVLGQIAELDQTLSPLESSIDHFFDRLQLHWILRDLFDDYLGFCIRCLYQLRAQRRHKASAIVFAAFVGVSPLLAVPVLREL